MIYLAGPYTHEDAEIRKARYKEMVEWTADYFSRGFYVICPVVHSHPPAVSEGFELPTDFGFWRGWCVDVLRRCDSMHILMMDGWSDSVGVRHEMRVADALSLEISMINV